MGFKVPEYRDFSVIVYIEYYYAGKPFYNFFISTSFSTFFISTFFGGFAPLPGANPAPSGLGLPPVALASAVIV